MKTSGSAGTSRPSWRTSATTPTISRNGVWSLGKPCLTRLPSAPPWGHHFFAKLSLTITTFGRVGAVGLREQAALAQREPERREVAAARRRSSGRWGARPVRARAGRRGRRSSPSTCRPAADNRRRSRPARRAAARSVVDRAPVEERARSAPSDTWLPGPNIERQDVLGRKPGETDLHAGQAADQKTRADDQDERERDLRHEEQGAEALARAARGRRRGSLSPVRPGDRDAKRRSQA